MPETLLSKAKAHRANFTKGRVANSDSQLQDLAIAWLRGEVSFGQSAAATGVTGSSLYGLLAVALRHAAEDGRIKIRVYNTDKL